MKKVLLTAAALGFCLYLPVAAFAGSPAASSADSVSRELQDLRDQLASQRAEIDMLKSQKAAAPVDLSAEHKRLDALEKENWVHAAKKKVDVTLYGQVNKGILFADDGHEDDVFFVDNTISGTRLGVNAKSKLNDEFSVGGQMEFEWTQNGSNRVEMGVQSHDADAQKRQMKVYAQSKTAGKLTLGHGSVAADGIAEIDLSGTSVAANTNLGAQGGAFKFKRTDATNTGVTVSSIFDNLDGARKDGLRYDSPKFFGVTLSGTVAENNYNDVAIGYDDKFGDTQVKAGLAYTIEGAGSSTHNKLSGSASVLLPFGLSFTLAAGEKEFDTASFDDGQYVYGKVGYQMKALSFGKTAFSVDYGKFDDMNGAASTSTQYDGTAYGAQFVQKFDAINTEFYLAYRLYDLDDNLAATEFEDISLLLAGARFSF